MLSIDCTDITKHSQTKASPQTTLIIDEASSTALISLANIFEETNDCSGQADPTIACSVSPAGCFTALTHLSGDKISGSYQFTHGNGCTSGEPYELFCTDSHSPPNELRSQTIRLSVKKYCEQVLTLSATPAFSWTEYTSGGTATVTKSLNDFFSINSSTCGMSGEDPLTMSGASCAIPAGSCISATLAVDDSTMDGLAGNDETFSLSSCT